MTTTKKTVSRRVVRKNKKLSIWRSWRHFAAYVYLFICFFDFVGMPIYYEWAHAPLSDIELLAQIKLLALENQIEAMKILTTEQRWEPLTLGENGLFHLAFGAILGVAAWTRGSEKTEHARRGYDEIELEEFEEEPPIYPEDRRRRRRRGRDDADIFEPEPMVYPEDRRPDETC